MVDFDFGLAPGISTFWILDFGFGTVPLLCVIDRFKKGLSKITKILAERRLWFPRKVEEPEDDMTVHKSPVAVLVEYHEDYPGLKRCLALQSTTLTLEIYIYELV